MRSRATAILAFCVTISALAAPASAIAEESWHLIQKSGDVRVTGQGFNRVSVESNQILPKDGWIETGANGRAVLVHGADSLIVGPGSRIQLPSDTVNGNTRILQNLGSVFYQIGKEAVPHFQVDTPYLAAVVKGTAFVVSVQDDSARVDVTEGLVQVVSVEEGIAEFVRPGFTGHVTSATGEIGKVEVSPTSSLPFDSAPRAGGDSVFRDGQGNSSDNDSARSDDKSLLEQPAQVDSQANDGDAVHEPSVVQSGSLISVPIGDLSLDIRAVSGGLASGAVGDAGVSSGVPASTTKQANRSGSISGAAQGGGSTSLIGSQPAVTGSAAVIPGGGADASAPLLVPSSPSESTSLVGGGGAGAPFESAPAGPDPSPALAPDLGGGAPADVGNGNSGNNGNNAGNGNSGNNGNNAGGGGNQGVVPPGRGGGG